MAEQRYQNAAARAIVFSGVVSFLVTTALR